MENKLSRSRVGRLLSLCLLFDAPPPLAPVWSIRIKRSIGFGWAKCWTALLCPLHLLHRHCSAVHLLLSVPWVMTLDDAPRNDALLGGMVDVRYPKTSMWRVESRGRGFILLMSHSNIQLVYSDKWHSQTHAKDPFAESASRILRRSICWSIIVTTSITFRMHAHRLKPPRAFLHHNQSYYQFLRPTNRST